MRINGVVTAGGKVPPNPPTNVIFNNLSIGRPYNDGAILVTFTPSANQGKYPASYTVGTSGLPMTITGSSSPITLTGLPSNYFTTPFIYASNTWGQSSVVTGSGIATATVPDSPSIGTATATGSTTASVTFGVPADGGSAITGYTVTSSPGGLTGTGTSSPITVAGLTTGTAYTFTVTATNANGTSLASAASNSITPSVTRFWSYLNTPTAGRYVSVDTTPTFTVAGGRDVSGDWFIAQYAKNGTINWQQKITAAGTETLSKITIDSSNNVYAVGTEGSGLEVITKINASGTGQWFKRTSFLTGSFSDVKVDGSGNIYCIGRYVSGTSKRLLLLKLNSTPSVVWARSASYGTTSDSNSDTWRGLAIDGNGDVFIAGFDTNGLGETNSAILLKYDSSGTALWGKDKGSAGFGDAALFNAVTTDSSNNVYVVGGVADGITGVIYKFDSSGTFLWGATLTSSTGLNTVALDSSNNVYVANATGSAQGLLAKYNSSGTLQWQRTIKYGTTGVIIQEIKIDSTNNTIAISGYVGGTSGFPFYASLPTDGSGTGAYTLGAYTINYAAGTFTASSITDFGIGSAGYTTTTGVPTLSDVTAMTRSTTTYTNNLTTI